MTKRPHETIDPDIERIALAVAEGIRRAERARSNSALGVVGLALRIIAGLVFLGCLVSASSPGGSTIELVIAGLAFWFAFRR